MAQRLAWYDFSFELPDSWEATRYSIAAPTGRFEFNDRHGSQGRLSWALSKRVPDEERILTEYHRRYLQDHDEDAYRGFRGIKTRKIKDWFVGYRHQGEPLQAVLYLPECKKTLLWVFPEYTPGKWQGTWAPVLESFSRNSGAWRDWAAFGVHCALPEGFEIEKVVCNPADVWFEFQHRNMQRIDIHRWGLPGELLRGRDMESFIRKVTTSQEGRIITATKSRFRGMESLELTIETRGTKGMDRLYASHWTGVGRAWLNTEEKRLYAYFQAGPKKLEMLSEARLFPE